MRPTFLCSGFAASDPIAACADAGVKPALCDSFFGFHFSLLRPPVQTTPISRVSVSCEEPWQAEQKITSAPFDETVRQFIEYLDEAVGQIVQHRKRVGILLSGGVDSLLVAQSVKRLGVEPVALSWSLRDYPEADETDLCSRHACNLGIEHEIVPVGHLGIGRTIDQDQTLHWPDCNPYLPFFRALGDRARERGVDILLGGDGGDGLCAVHRYRLADFWRTGRRLKACAMGVSLGFRSGWRDQRVRAFAELAGRRPRPPLRNWMSEAANTHVRALPQAYSTATRPTQARASIPGNAPEFGIRYSDFADLPLRFPYRDPQLINFALRVPAYHLLGPNGEKKLFLAATERVEEYALNRRTGLLNDYFHFNFIERPAMDWRALVEDCVDLWSKYLRVESIRTMLSHTRPTPAQCALLWRLVCFVVWRRKLMQSTGEET